MKREILLGDEAVGLGAVHAGLSGIYGYPGTPSTEISSTSSAAEKGRDSTRWSPTKRSLTRTPWACRRPDKRALVSMKHVGLNVAADPFMSSALTGVNGGLVLAVADDPGMHSSQNEQDSRFFAEFAQIPSLSRRNQQEAYDMTMEAFDLSEELAYR